MICDFRKQPEGNPGCRSKPAADKVFDIETSEIYNSFSMSGFSCILRFPSARQNGHVLWMERKTFIMKKFTVKLSTIDDVKNFVSAANMQYADIDVVSGRDGLDAKSILGLFSLDLSKPIEIIVYGTEDDAEKFQNAVKDVIVER
jgi:phosphotransferase system HPr-like phosphotransfer protein